MMRHEGILPDKVTKRKRVFRTLTILICLLSIAVLFESSNPPITQADVIIFPDEDHDVLSDMFEDLYGTNYMNPDTDGDGAIDSIEFLFKTDPVDPLDIPVLQPGMQVAAYQLDDVVKLSMVFYPGDNGYLESFAFVTAFLSDLLNNPGSMEILDLTEFIPLSITEASFTLFEGFVVSAYSLDMPIELIEDYGPLCVGVCARIAGVPCTDVLTFEMLDGVVVRLTSAEGLGFNTDQYYYSALSTDPPGDWSSEEVCMTELELIESYDGLNKYEVKEAACEELIRQLCSPSQCEALVGTEVITIDPGFLIGLTGK